MNARGIMVVALALVCGLSAVFLVKALRSPVAAPVIERTPVVFAVDEVKVGEMVTEKGVEVRQVPVEQVPEDAIRKVADAIDRAARSTIDKGDMLRTLKLAEKGAGRGMAALIEPGMRAVVIQTPSFSASLGGFLLPGNRVDINLTASTGPNGPVLPRTLLEDVKVLAVDRNVNQPAANKINPEETRFVTVEVTPEDALKLDLGQNQGTLTLKLRNPADKARGVATLAPPVAPAQPVAPPAPPEPRPLAERIAPGMRAFTIDLDKFSATLAAHLVVDSRVDVIYTGVTDDKSKDLTGGASTIMLLRDVKVLEVQPMDNKAKGDMKLPEVPPEAGVIPDLKPAPQDSRYVTLEVTPAEAQKLDLGQQMGKLHLALRGATPAGRGGPPGRATRTLVALDPGANRRGEGAERPDEAPGRLLAHDLDMVPSRPVPPPPSAAAGPRVVAHSEVRTLRGTQAGLNSWTVIEPGGPATPPPGGAAPAPARAPKLDRSPRNLASAP